MAAALKSVFGDSSGERMPNGVTRARRVPRKAVGFRKTSGNIAAIDFGTKNCSLAYVTGRDELLIPGEALSKLPLNGTYSRVPTAILLNAAKDVEAFGYDARLRYANLEPHERRTMYYFDGIKISLQRDKDVNRSLPVKALNGTEFLLVDVIACILGYLRREFIERHLQRGGHAFSATDFDWVVTVPAIWRAGGKQMMREAGYKGGLCSDGPVHVVAAAEQAVPRPPSPVAELSPERLSLALEPESGAIYCHEMLKRKQVAHHCATPDPSTLPLSSYSYLIVDIGGGTVDVSAHKVYTTPKLHVEELHPPVGNDWGGLMVNREFSIFLQKQVKDRNFSRLLFAEDEETRITNRFELDEMINNSFEEQKKVFGHTERENRRSTVVRLPETFLDMYRDTLTASLDALAKFLRSAGREDELVKLERNNLRIPPAKMEQFLTPAITGIMECVQSLMETLSSTSSIDVIYLVGGFGGCPYVYEKFTEKYGNHCKIIVPPNPEYAIVEGAVLFRANPSIVRSRKADATYGKSVVRQFEKIHDPQYKSVDADGVGFCQNLFQTIVGIGETIIPDSVYMTSSHPLRPDQPKMHIQVFTSRKPAHEVWYTTPQTTVLIGELTLKLPEVPREGKERVVEVIFDFSHTEIQVRAYDKSSEAEVTTVIDFLSASPDIQAPYEVEVGCELQGVSD